MNPTADYTARYRAARQAYYAAESFTAQDEAAALSDQILETADLLGLDIDIATIERECDPTTGKTRTTVYVGENAVGQPVYDVVWV